MSPPPGRVFEPGGAGPGAGDGKENMNLDDAKTTFDRDGFVIVPQLLSPAEFAELRANLDRYIREVVPRLPDKHAFYVDKCRPETLKQMQHMGCDPYFRDYTNHPTWRALA